MKLNTRFFLLHAQPWYTVYDDGDAAATDAAATDAATTDTGGDQGQNGDKGKGEPPDPELDKPKFSQKQLGKLLAEERKKIQEQSKKQIADLEKIKETANLTQKQKEELQTRIEELNNSLLTKEEQAKRDKERLAKDYQKTIKTLEEDRETWRSRYTTERIAREITDAAKANKGYNEQQFVRQLANDARLVEAVDAQGQPTGNLAVQIRFTDSDKEGKPIVLDLSASEAVKRMKEMPEYLNFFESGASGGLGAGRTSGGANGKAGKDPKDMTPAEYRKYREEKKQQSSKK